MMDSAILEILKKLMMDLATLNKMMKVLVNSEIFKIPLQTTMVLEILSKMMKNLVILVISLKQKKMILSLQPSSKKSPSIK